eukprot:TRINITY_DN78292_c0_g1_i1.p1 TRINITY_DN78292_c0_g1~~TRINITY_DN78292_c0_g1_i1.p1  ORF type:complete len:261 (+),score=25.63 TRINITY_DN78292_c0_g1_i1:81-863(+)
MRRQRRQRAWLMMVARVCLLAVRHASAVALRIPLRDVAGFCGAVDGVPRLLNGSAAVAAEDGRVVGRILEPALSQRRLLHAWRRAPGAGPGTEAHDDCLAGSESAYFFGHRMLTLAPPVWVGGDWSLTISWRPAQAKRGPLSGQSVYAIAKSSDSSQGLLLFTAAGEVGIWTEERFHGVAIGWQSWLLDGTFHVIQAAAFGGTTKLRIDGREVAEVPVQPTGFYFGRVGGDVSCSFASSPCAPQGAGELRDLHFQSADED